MNDDRLFDPGHEETDAEALRQEDQARAAARRRRIFARLRKRWAYAKVTPSGLKPFAQLLHHAASAGGQDFQEEVLWKCVVQSVRDGYSDEEHHLYSMLDRRVRITSALLRETLRWDDQEPLIIAIVSQSFASVFSLTAWAKAYHYEPPSIWLQALASKKPASATRARAGKGQATSNEIQKAFVQVPKLDGELDKNYHLRISDELLKVGVKAGTSRIRREPRSGKIGKN